MRSRQCRYNGLTSAFLLIGFGFSHFAVVVSSSSIHLNKFPNEKLNLKIYRLQYIGYNEHKRHCHNAMLFGLWIKNLIQSISSDWEPKTKQSFGNASKEENNLNI